MDKILNTSILSHPLNWLTVFLMCALALMALALIFPDQVNSSSSAYGPTTAFPVAGPQV